MPLVTTVAVTLCLVSSGKACDPPGHPRLHFTASDLQKLRADRKRGIRARIWKNIASSADWCLTRTPRREWIAPVSPDPVYLNLYNRFNGMMSDMAVMEHLAFAYAYSGDSRYLEAARKWTLNACRVWRREADGEADASKAYAVMRILKGISTSYDILYSALSISERNEIRRMLREVGHKYYQWYLDNPKMGTMQQGAHHSSVETTSLGIAALALLGEVREADDWLELMIRKHTEDLLPRALTPSGAQTEGPTFWVSTMQYRIAFMDALRRVTGRDLFAEYAMHMSGSYAQAVCASPHAPRQYDESRQSVLFHPSYGQLDYLSPVLLYLSREYRRPVHQYLALWDSSLGSLQKTRYVTSDGEGIVFQWGGYAYAWYDETIEPAIDKSAPLSFHFPEVNQAYARSSYEPNGLVTGQWCGVTEVHAGGRPVLVEAADLFHWPKATEKLDIRDDGKRAAITSSACPELGYESQTMLLDRPCKVTITRKTTTAMRWWCHGKPARAGNTIEWPDGARVSVIKGSIASFDPEGYDDSTVTGMGLLKCADPMPMKYLLVSAQPDDGELGIEITAVRE